MEKINLIYILGRAFTGSTILEMILEAHPEIMSAGEMIYLPRIYNSRNKIKCSCGQTAENCSVWSQIFNIYKNKNKNSKDTFKLSPDKSYLKSAFKKVSKLFNNYEIKKYGEKNLILFNTIKKLTGKNIIVDSSKDPLRLLLLKKSNLFNLKVIYLYRDGRASIDSFKKRQRHKYNIFHRMFMITGGEFFIRKILRKAFKRNEYYGIKYETFTENFEKEIISLLKFLNLENEKELYTNDSRKDFFINRINNIESHIVGGNIYRLQEVKKITNFEKWKENLNRKEKILFAVLGGKLINKTVKKYLH